MDVKIERKFRVLQEIAKDHDASSWAEIGPVSVAYYKGLLAGLYAVLKTCNNKINVDRLETRLRLLTSYARSPYLVTICLHVATSLVVHCGKFEMREGIKNALKVLLCISPNLTKVNSEVQDAAISMALTVRMGTDVVLTDASRRMSEAILLSKVRKKEA